MSVAAMRRWVTEQALPVWGDLGFDAREEQFVERIGFDGVPHLDAPRRVMVQARQIYVFGLAHERGWTSSAGRLAEAAYGQLRARYGASGGADGWAFAVDRSGRVVDPTRDLYAQAFVLLALATIRRLGGGEEPLKLARETLAFMDARMAASGGGYSEAVPNAGARRRQNPHMHLLEALLAWHALVPNEGFDVRAWDVLDLLTKRFLVRREDGAAALAEYFDENLVSLGGSDQGFEPGHHFEWVWLVKECARLTGRASPDEASALWTSAVRFGFRDDGTIFDEVTMSGTPLAKGIRLWPLTEAMKASRCGLTAPANMKARSTDDLAGTLLKTFLRSAPSGLWYDHFDEGGRLKNESAPASSLYHICCALSECDGDPLPL